MSTSANNMQLTGLLQPPPDLALVIDKTAAFVARNGAEFEQRILTNEKSNPKFSFLQPHDPFHPYYMYKISESSGQADPLPAPSAEQLAEAERVQRRAASTVGGSRQPAFESAESDDKKINGQLKEWLEQRARRHRRQERLAENPDQSQEAQEAANVIRMEKEDDAASLERRSVWLCDLPPALPAIDTDILKTTALFIAKHGDSFLSGLAARESRNPGFAFLRPVHPLHATLRQLIEQYTRCLLPAPNAAESARQAYGDRDRVLERCARAHERETAEAAKKAAEEAAADAERAQLASIDWHDYVIVAAVDFDDEATADKEGRGEEEGLASLPEPVTLDELRALNREAASEAVVAANEAAEQQQDMEMGNAAAAPVGLAAAKPTEVDAETQMRADLAAYEADERRLAENAAVAAIAGDKPAVVFQESFERKSVPGSNKRGIGALSHAVSQICPRCGQAVPADEMAEHMRLELLDPKYRRDRAVNAARTTPLALGAESDVAANLQRMARRRTDIFGASEVETEVGKEVSLGSAGGAALDKQLEEIREATQLPGSGSDVGKQETGGALLQLNAQHQQQQQQQQHMMQRTLQEKQMQLQQKLKQQQLELDAKREELQRQMQMKQQQQQQQGNAGAGASLLPGVPAPPPGSVDAPPPPPQGGMPPPPPGMSSHPPGMPPPPPGMPPPPPGMSHPPGMPPPPPGMFHPPGVPPPPPGMDMGVPPPGAELGGAPPAKRFKAGQEIVPADYWLSLHPEDVGLTVEVPPAEGAPAGANGCFNGQKLSIKPMAPTSSVFSLKAAIAVALGANSPAPKKLKLKGTALQGFLKDDLTLADCNLLNEQSLSLTLKERGGKRKK